MTVQQSLPDHAESSPRRARRRLTLVAPLGGGVHRTFAEDVEIVSTGPAWRRRERMAPAGFVHAAQVEGEWSLCGILLDSLHEFDRGRFSFDRLDGSRQCAVCRSASRAGS